VMVCEWDGIGTQLGRFRPQAPLGLLGGWGMAPRPCLGAQASPRVHRGSRAHLPCNSRVRRAQQPTSATAAGTSAFARLRRAAPSGASGPPPPRAARGAAPRARAHRTPRAHRGGRASPPVELPLPGSEAGGTHLRNKGTSAACGLAYVSTGRKARRKSSERPRFIAHRARTAGVARRRPWRSRVRGTASNSGPSGPPCAEEAD